jgi:hypothetical protein
MKVTRRSGKTKKASPNETIIWITRPGIHKRHIELIFKRPRYQGTHNNSINPQLESFTPQDALARALASPRTPSEFNSKFNQNSMTRESEENYFSCFSNVEEEDTSELGDYFSDNEEH